MRDFSISSRLVGIAIFASAALAGPVLAQGIVYGGSNLSYLGYPEHSCHKPMKPFSNDEFAWNMFVNDVEQYKRCIKDYVDNADSDMQRVTNARNEAVQDWNRFAQSL